MKETIKVALVGNPNTGKTSVFNTLTGLNQRVGNYPGITVDKKTGSCKLSETISAKIFDLPGTYSLNASSIDESVTVKVLLDEENKDYPDVAVVITEVENLKRNLLLFTQIKDLEIPSILVLNMKDQIAKKGITIDILALEQQLKTKIILTSARTAEGINELKEAILNFKALDTSPCCNALNFDEDYFNILKKDSTKNSVYKAWLDLVNNIENDATEQSTLKRNQQREIIQRYKFINEILKDTYSIDRSKASDLRSKLDRVLTHKIWGFVIFFVILHLIFQALFAWSSYPMDFIDESFVSLGEWVGAILPEGAFTSLLSEGIIPGIGGVVIFIPQIAFLFLFISVLEESGYMSRVVFIMDKLMRRFGLSGKSVVPLISGTACAIPAIMSARNIESWKERLITILVTPFTTCAARLPVYAIIIELVMPDEDFFGGLFNLKGLTLMALYFLGFLSAVFGAYILDKILAVKHKSYFVVEMPDYKAPILKNVFLTVFEKSKAFVLDAGKIILAISIILWVLASYGPGEQFQNAEQIVSEQYQELSNEELQNEITSHKLEHSYLGIIGKTIEPAIKPLGYDWKIGIGLVASFAAREVFVGTLATIYSIGSEEEGPIIEQMQREKHASTGKPVFTFATGISLLLFYAFAMQCMATLAIVKRETNSWKWPVVQLVGMSAIAYLSALISFQILS